MDTPVLCPVCGTPSEPSEIVRRIHRGDRFVDLKIPARTCPLGCKVGASTWIEALAVPDDIDTLFRQAWQDTHGEAMPEDGRRRRKAASELRRKRVILMLSEEEVKSLDAVRGKISRSEYLRQLALAPDPDAESEPEPDLDLDSNPTQPQLEFDPEALPEGVDTEGVEE